MQSGSVTHQSLISVLLPGGQRTRDVKLVTYRHLVPILEMSGSVGLHGAAFCLNLPSAKVNWPGDRISERTLCDINSDPDGSADYTWHERCGLGFKFCSGIIN